MRVFILLLAVFCSTAFAKIETNACEQSIVNYGLGHSNVTQVGRFEIQYKDGTLGLSEFFSRKVFWAAFQKKTSTLTRPH
jgi:hypothetical protein